MKKLLTFLLTALLAFSVGWAETVTDFQETFSRCDGTSGWSGSAAANSWSSTYADNSGWTMANGYRGDKCVRLGTSGKLGSAESPSINVTSGVSYTLTFKAGAWSGDATTLKLSATGGNLNSSTVTMSQGAWTDYTITFTASSSTAKIKFEGNAASKSRFFIDEIVLTHETGGGTSDPIIYRKVSSADELIAGTKSVIVYENNGTIYGFGELNTNRYATGVSGLTATNNTIDIARAHEFDPWRQCWCLDIT